MLTLDPKITPEQNIQQKRATRPLETPAPRMTPTQEASLARMSPVVRAAFERSLRVHAADYEYLADR